MQRGKYYIEHVDEQNGTGTIHSLVNLVKNKVCVTGLKEQ
ncbi:small, acid-soluble spore protein, H family [Peribacillus frigoritolerans]